MALIVKAGLPSAEEVRARLDYDPKTGIFTWRARTDIADKRTRNAWNAKYAGQRAGTLHSEGYWQIRLPQGIFLAHNLAWLHYYGHWPRDLLDHKNCMESENWIDNLREATPSQNCANTRVSRNNLVGLKGVSRNRRGTFYARIVFHGKRHHLGTFDTAEEAHLAYLSAATSMQGEFARG